MGFGVGGGGEEEGGGGGRLVVNARKKKSQSVSRSELLPCGREQRLPVLLPPLAHGGWRSPAQSWVDAAAAEIRVEVGSDPIGSWLHRRWDRSDPSDRFTVAIEPVGLSFHSTFGPRLLNVTITIIITTATIIKMFLFILNHIRRSSFLYECKFLMCLVGGGREIFFQCKKEKGTWLNGLHDNKARLLRESFPRKKQ